MMEPWRLIFESKCVAMTSGAVEFKGSTKCEALQKSQVLVAFMRTLMTMSETPTFVVDTEKLSFWLAASMKHLLDEMKSQICIKSSAFPDTFRERYLYMEDVHFVLNSVRTELLELYAEFATYDNTAPHSPVRSSPRGGTGPSTDAPVRKSMERKMSFTDFYRLLRAASMFDEYFSLSDAASVFMESNLNAFDGNICWNAESTCLGKLDFAEALVRIGVKRDDHSRPSAQLKLVLLEVFGIFNNPVERAIKPVWRNFFNSEQPFGEFTDDELLGSFRTRLLFSAGEMHIHLGQE